MRTIHDLDIARKHERLIAVNADVSSTVMLGTWSGWRVGGAKPLHRLNNKTILGRLRPGEILTATQGNTLLTVFVVFNEPTLGIADKEVVEAIREFIKRVSEVIKLFDG